MILMADHLLTGDGATHRADAALRLDEKGRIAWIGSRREASRIWRNSTIS